MEKIIAIIIAVMVLGIVFTGCETKEVAVENDGFVNEILTEEIITEEIIVEDIIVETIWVSPEYQSEVEFNSRTNES